MRSPITFKDSTTVPQAFLRIPGVIPVVLAVVTCRIPDMLVPNSTIAHCISSDPSFFKRVILVADRRNGKPLSAEEGPWRVYPRTMCATRVGFGDWSFPRADGRIQPDLLQGWGRPLASQRVRQCRREIGHPPGDVIDGSARRSLRGSQRRQDRFTSPDQQEDPGSPGSSARNSATCRARRAPVTG